MPFLFLENLRVVVPALASARVVGQRCCCLRSRCPAPPELSSHCTELLFHRSRSLGLAEPGLGSPAAPRTRTYVADLESVQVCLIRALPMQATATRDTEGQL